MAKELISDLAEYHGDYFLYTLYENKVVAFVGITDNPKQRIKEIVRDKPWGIRITHFEIETLPGFDKSEAITLRNRVVNAEHPRYNLRLTVAA